MNHQSYWLGGRSPKAGMFLRRLWGRRCGLLGIPLEMPLRSQDETLRLAERAGFRCAFMNTGGGFRAKIGGAKISGAKINRFALPRVHVTADMSLSEFEAHISGFYRSLRKRLLGGDELEALAGA